MRIKKATTNTVASLVYCQDGKILIVWGYPNQVHFEINGTAVSIKRGQFKKILKFLKAEL